jgi:UDP-N-acetylglucosamine--N-acetylmuramyl-(pentapeptide) pyrophosphoryl-undecaprenol N-acetylglucosamine transferase
MEFQRGLTIVNYAVNGSGVGHVQRLCAVNRWMRRYAAFAGIRSQHWFLTTSEADTWLFAENFAAFKLPSKSIVESAGIPKPQYLAMAKQWIWTALSVLRPDLLVVDTFPNGSFDELAPALDLCVKKALVLRPVRPEIGERPGFRALAGLYDRVIVPEDQDAGPPTLGVEPLRTGPIMLDERFEIATRAEARKRLGVEDDKFCLLISGGGGGDAGIPTLFDAAEAAAGDDPSVHLVFAAGPLCRALPRRGRQRTWWTEPGLGQMLAGVDGAISAAGFNSVHELLHAGVPTALVAQRKIADDQEARADAFVRRGAALRLPSVIPSALSAVLARLRDPACARDLAAAARRAVPRNAARDAAAALLELCVPRSLVHQAVDVLDDALLAEARTLGVGVDDLVDVAMALNVARRPVDRAALELDSALALARSAAAAGLPASGLGRLVALFSRKLCGPDCGPEHNGDAMARLISHPTATGQWSALTSLLNVLPQAREPDTHRATNAIIDLIDAGAARGLTVSHLAQTVVQVQSEEDVGPQFFEHVRARLGATA